MTCIEKLRELHPEWSEEEIEDSILTLCPSDFGIRWERPSVCGFANSWICERCWGTEAGGGERKYDLY